jgi:hypothetical protein
MVQFLFTLSGLLRCQQRGAGCGSLGRGEIGAGAGMGGALGLELVACPQRKRNQGGHGSYPCPARHKAQGFFG